MKLGMGNDHGHTHQHTKGFCDVTSGCYATARQKCQKRAKWCPGKLK